MAAKRKPLLTIVDAVLEVIGLERARTLAGVKGRTSPLMWKKRQGFPPTSYAAMTAALTLHGYIADPSLWRQVRPGD